ncbi:MAG: hypothetical protein K2H16_06070 [Prevotella sp.]|nr:hypothetical protein [Prevotella sp.]
MNSKIEARIEAVKLAVNVKGVTDKNVIAVSEEIAKYILGDAELPEMYDTLSAMREMVSKTFRSPSYPAYDGKVPAEIEEKEQVAEKKEH